MEARRFFNLINIFDKVQKDDEKACPVERGVIKPCPFCGDKSPEIMDDGDDFDTYVVCGFCGARGEWATGQHKEATKLAIEFWNRRAL